jgi:hypothetical protein
MFPLTVDSPMRACLSVHGIQADLFHRVIDDTEDRICALGINNAQGQTPDLFAIQRFEKYIRGEKIPLCWYESHGTEPVAQPLTPRPTQSPSDLFIHNHANRRSFGSWIWTGGGRP